MSRMKMQQEFLYGVSGLFGIFPRPEAVAEHPRFLHVQGFLFLGLIDCSSDCLSDSKSPMCSPRSVMMRIFLIQKRHPPPTTP